MLRHVPTMIFCGAGKIFRKIIKLWVLAALNIISAAITIWQNGFIGGLIRVVVFTIVFLPADSILQISICQYH